MGLYRLFVPLQAGLLVNHLAPVKLGEFVRPLLAARYGVPIAEAATTTAMSLECWTSRSCLVIAMIGRPFHTALKWWRLLATRTGAVDGE